MALLASAVIAQSASALKCVEPDDDKGMSEAVIVDDVPLVHTMQVMGAKGDAAAQADESLSKLETLLKSAGSSLEAACKLNVYVSKDQNVTAVQKVLAKRFKGPVKPAATFVTTRLPDPGSLVAMDAVAAAHDDGSAAPLDSGMRAFAILPKGPKSYVSGMADTNGLAQATERTLEKLTACIAHLGLEKKDIVQLKAFLEPMSDSARVRKKIVEYFGNSAPPVIFVEWSSPKPNPPIEIELIAPAKPDRSKEADPVSYVTPPGTTDSKVFKRVAQVNHGKLIYISGIYGEISGDGGVQVREIFRALKGTLQRTGSDFDHLVKATYYVTDDQASNKLNEMRPQYYKPDRPPAASKAKVRGVGMPEKTVMLDMIAVPRP